MSASGLPGNRVEANRAGMTATMSSGGTESTVEPVDAGCTTNNSTTAKWRVLRSRGVTMNVKRTATIVVVGARARRVARRRRDVESRDRAARRSSQPTPIDKRGAELADRNRAAARAAASERRAASAGPQSVPFTPRAARRVRAPSPAPRRRSPSRRRRRPPLPPLKLVRHRRGPRRRRSGPHRDHLRRRAAVHGQGRRERHAALPRREDLRRRRRARRRHRQQRPTARASMSVGTRSSERRTRRQLRAS